MPYRCDSYLLYFSGTANLALVALRSHICQPTFLQVIREITATMTQQILDFYLIVTNSYEYDFAEQKTFSKWPTRSWEVSRHFDNHWCDLAVLRPIPQQSTHFVLFSAAHMNCAGWKSFNVSSYIVTTTYVTTHISLLLWPLTTSVTWTWVVTVSDQQSWRCISQINSNLVSSKGFLTLQIAR